MPTASTKDRATRRPVDHAGADREGAEFDGAESSGRLALVRRRIADGYYDRLEVRRTVATLLLRSLARRGA